MHKVTNVKVVSGTITEHFNRYYVSLVCEVEEVKNYTANNYIDIVSLIAYLRYWLLNHILIEDKAFVYEVKAILKKTDN